MTRKNDEFEQMIKDNLRMEAEAIEKRVEMSGVEDITDEQKEAILRQLKVRMEAYERERAYAGLSEEDKAALELGRKIREEQKAEKKNKFTKRFKRYAGVAAVFVCVLIFGMSSIGHGEKFSSKIEQMFGKRKIVQIDSDKENQILENDETAAFQKIKETFGVDAVSLVKITDMEFISAEIDEGLQVAQLLYQYEGENLWYIIGAGYYDSSFGIDTEDEIIEKEDIDMEETTAELTIYRRKGSGLIKCSAHFTYQKLEYFLAGNISAEDFEFILKNLYF